MSNLFNEFVEPENFEEGVKRLEEIVRRLEGGEESLEDMLNLFKEANKLTRWCYSRLEKVEQEVKVLTETEQGFELKPFKPLSDETQ